MAQVIQDKIYKEVNGSIVWTLFEELENAFSWQSVTGGDDYKVFRISGSLAIRFENFETARASGSTTTYGRIYAMVGENEELITTFMGSVFTSDRQFKIIVGSAGDIALQLGSGTYDQIPVAGAGLRFAVVNVQDTTDDNVTGYGIYTPKVAGTRSNGSVTFNDATPKFFYTDDTTNLTNNTNLQYLSNDPNAKIMAVWPIFGVVSNCVSTSAFVLAMGKPDVLQGKTQVEGVIYYAIGGLFFLEASS